MGCQSCKNDAKVAGCNQNGGCLTGGCNKQNTFDWLTTIAPPTTSTFDVVEVRFKGGRKEFYRNAALPLTTGDPVIVEAENGYHLGYVSLQGELVRLQMAKKEVKNEDRLRKIRRKATLKDLEKFKKIKEKEAITLLKARKFVDELKLVMKLSDVEYQADDKKATFYYSAVGRVDFRELLKVLIKKFKIRVEMCQISPRQEAGRIGGIGSCGRELCCSTWLSSFKSVTTSAVRYQNLSLNPKKISGQCGRLKCCLNYELDTYIEALKDIPKVKEPLITKKGEAVLQKTDIFRKIMWFSYVGEIDWHPIGVQRVVEIQALNKNSIHPKELIENNEVASEG